MDIIELKKDEYSQIKSLWEKLNQIHGERSKHFKDHFASFTFEKRMESLFSKEQLVVFAARYRTEYIGYCIASLEGTKGEIDSIYIEKAFQQQKVGSFLMDKAMGWLKENQCDEISVSIADGNESVSDFYKRFGFYKRFLVLQRKQGR